VAETNEMNPHIRRQDALDDAQLWAMKYRRHPRSNKLPFLFEREIRVNKAGLKAKIPNCYLQDIYGTLKRPEDLFLAILKPRQAEISEFAMNASLYLCDKYDGFKFLYILPTKGLGRQFLLTRFDPTIEYSPYLSAAIGQSEEKNELRGKRSSTVDSLDLKRLRRSWLYILTSEAKNASRSPDADGALFDEYNFHNMANEESFTSALDHSDMQLTIYLSTPTLPDFGIDLYYKNTSRGEWTINCPHCSSDFVMNSKYFFGNGVKLLDVPREYDGALRIFVCPQCGGEITTFDKQTRGRYVHAEPGLLKENKVGFHFSNLILANVTADRAWGQYQKFLLKPSGLKKYKNEKLGEASVDEEARDYFTRQSMLECCDNRIGWVDAGFDTMMGVDWGKETHVTVWKDVNGKLQLLNFIVIPPSDKPLDGAKKVAELIPRFNPNTLICDFGAGQEQNKYIHQRFKNIVWFAVNVETMKDLELKWNQNTRIVNYEVVTAYMTYSSWYAADMIVLPAYDAKLELFIQHHVNSCIIDPENANVDIVTNYLQPVGKPEKKTVGQNGPIHLLSSSLFGWLKNMGSGMAEFSFSEIPKEKLDKSDNTGEYGGNESGSEHAETYLEHLRKMSGPRQTWLSSM